MDSETLINMKELIESMEIMNQKDILNILKKNNVNISENNNGSFINLSNLSQEVLDQIKEYIKYFNNQEKNLLFIEEEKINIKKEFFYTSNKYKINNKSKEIKETVSDDI